MAENIKKILSIKITRHKKSVMLKVVERNDKEIINNAAIKKEHRAASCTYTRSLFLCESKART